MRLCVLNASYEQSSSAFREHDPYAHPGQWLPEHTWDQQLIEKASVARQIVALVNEGYDAFVNLCDGAWDEDRAGIEVVQALERLGAAFTGAGSACYDPSRETMKLVCHYAGIRTPGWAFVRTPAEVARAADTLRFPLIVKHPNSYGSIGMGRDARVQNHAALVDRVERMAAAYGSALVEEFIDGREFTVLVAEPAAGEHTPRTYQPIEFLFAPGETFKHFDLKWINFAQMGCKSVEDATLAERLRTHAAAMFSGIGGSGYGRCDLRMNREGELYMLEINPNCGVFYANEAQYGSADFILAHDPAGHRGFLEHILDCGERRRARDKKRWRVAQTSGQGFGLVAEIDIPEGEIIQAFEGKPQPLVTRRHVERSWPARERQWFASYAWPITDEVFAIWSERPEDWRPINHCCDPSAWLDGLDLVARRALRAGDAITLDYATFCGPTMQDFDCHCGAVACRGRVRASDHLAPWLQDRYGEHVSDYVRKAREKAKDKTL